MALNQILRAVDRQLYFSKAYSLTVTTATYSTEIDLGAANMGKGKPNHVVVYIDTISATAASTILIEVAAATTVTPTTIVQDIGTAVTGSAAFEKAFTLPTDVARYVRLRYTLTGSAASSCVINAILTASVE